MVKAKERKQNTKAVRVFLVDDHEVARKGLGVILREEPDIKVVGEAESGEQAIKAIKKVNPDVVLMDIRLPGKDGFETADEIRKIAPEVSTLFLTGYESELYAAESRRVKAAGYITKDNPKNFLTSSIKVVAQGGSVWEIDPGPGYQMEDSSGRLMPVGPEIMRKGLTRRELEVLRLLAKGYSDKQISLALKIAESTASHHARQAMKKLGVKNRTQAALEAVKFGVN